jgi:hypothetical protein
MYLLRLMNVAVCVSSNRCCVCKHMCKSTHSSMPACIRRSYDVVTYNKLYACRMSHTLNTILRVRDPIRGFPIYIEKISVNIYRVGGYHYILNYRLAMPSTLYEEQHDGTKLRHDKNVTPGRAAGAAGPDQRGQYAHVRWTPARLRATWPGDPIPRVAWWHHIMPVGCGPDWGAWLGLAHFM